ncbi:MAG TPA: hypothetical protein VOA64_21625 [Candidatus Dormibacteraeota bacterium]|nr:hypothetical protein [Candidatus Dormibacteraeota bacterium]
MDSSVLGQGSRKTCLGVALVFILTGMSGCSSLHFPYNSESHAPAHSVSVSIAPPSASVQIGQPTTVTANVSNDVQNRGVSWSLSGAGCSGATCGTLSATSSASGAAITYTAPTSAPSPATVTLTATSVADGTKTVAATITITAAQAPAPAVAVVVSPANVSLLAGFGSQAFTATVSNDAQNKGVSWSLSGAGCSGATCGALSATSSASGVAITYTAPASVPSPATVTLSAASAADSTKTVAATITVTAVIPTNITVSISPLRGGLTVSQTLDFTANVANDVGNAGVKWSTTGGTFSGQNTTSATLVAPNAAGVFTITATSLVDSSKSASAQIGVTDLAGVTTYHNDLARDGVNAKEYALTPANVSTAFGKLFSCAVDGALYARPLWVANLNISGGNHNVIFAASSRDTVYAFDADASPCVTYWNKPLLGSGETWLSSTDVGTDHIAPDIGIVGTPTIDLATNTLYVVSKSKNYGGSCSPSSNCHQRLHALSLADGSEKFSSPVDITAAITVPGTGDGSSGGMVPFESRRENQRPGLALVNGIVYVSWASHGDNGPYHGWVIGFDKTTLSISSVLNVSPNGRQGGIWMSGGAPAADNNNNLYVITGNGDYDGTKDFGDTFLKLSTAGGLAVADWFTPFDAAALDVQDLDVGSGAAVVIVDLPNAPVGKQHLLVGGGKAGSGNSGQIYVLNRDSMGKQRTGSNAQIVQEFPLGASIFGSAAFWQNTMYIAGNGGPLRAFALNGNTGTFNTASTSQSSAFFGFPGLTPSVSANGSSSGIVWVLDNGQYNRSAAVLRAYDATNLATELWNSSSSAGVAVKFTVPTVANGKVYVGTRNEVSVYGLKPN